MIEWLPVVRLEVVIVAVMKPDGEDTRVPVPSVWPPSRNVTVPVAMQQGEMVAVKITAWPETEGLGLEVIVVVVLPLTIWLHVAEELP